MKDILSNLFKPKTIQKIVTILEILDNNEYVVKDSVNRKYRVKSDRQWKVNDTVVIQDNWILGRSKFDKNIKTFSV
jgi:hypothetical protein